MYRHPEIPASYAELHNVLPTLVFKVLLCIHVASAAPQSHESDVTYVKIQPLVSDSPSDAIPNTRESRIEKLPLTIPGNISISKEPDKIERIDSQSSESPEIKQESDQLSDQELTLSSTENTAETAEIASAEASETLSETDETPENVSEETVSTDKSPDLNYSSHDLTESDSEKVTDTVPSEANQSERRGRNFESVETTETAEVGTEKYELDTIDISTIPPKFVPKPKLSYFQKPRVFQSYTSNSVDNAGKRRFRSRCRCEKIWNCPKLQISVPRCPNEYFLCCF